MRTNTKNCHCMIISVRTAISHNVFPSSTKGAKGRTGSMVLCVTSDDPTGMVFQTGSGNTKVLYPVFHAQKQEIKLMTHIVDLIQKSSPTEAAGLNYECNMLHILITKLSAGRYSIHDDFSTLIGCLASDIWRTITKGLVAICCPHKQT